MKLAYLASAALAALSMPLAAVAASVPIGSFPAASGLSGPEQFVCNQSGATKTCTTDQIAAYAAASGPGLFHVANNTALQALSTASYTSVIRDGYAAAGDAPPVEYTASGSACSLGSGAGDGGYQIPSANSKCWIATFPNGVADFRTWGADPTGSSDAQALLTKVFALPVPLTIYFSPGTYRIGCGHYFTTSTAGLNFAGAGMGVSTLKLDSGCTLTADLFKADAKNGWAWRDLTIDLNTNTSGSLFNVIGAYAYAGDMDGFTVERVEIKNGVSPAVLIGGGAAGGHSLKHMRVAFNVLKMTAALTQNQCVGTTTVNGAGYIPDSYIASNRCEGAGMQVDGAGPLVILNDISGWKFGAGIFTTYQTGGAAAPTSNHDCLIAYNTIHDATDTNEDVNSDPHNGIENDCWRSTVIGNVVYNNAGAGIVSFTNYVTHIGNVAYNNGLIGSGSSQGAGAQAGFYIADASGGVGAQYAGTHNVYVGNTAYDNGTDTQKYGYYEEPSHTFSSDLRGNHFSGSTAAQVIQASSSSQSAGDVGYRKTLTSQVTTTTALTFTGLDTTAFKNWTLTCRTLTPNASASWIGVQVGEGATPTWETGAHYANQLLIVSNGASSTYATAGDTAMTPTSENLDNTQTAPGWFQMTFGDLAYGAGYRMVRSQTAYFKNGVGMAAASGSHTWANDTNPWTALRVVSGPTPGTSDFYGTCTLEGRP